MNFCSTNGNGFAIQFATSGAAAADTLRVWEFSGSAYIYQYVTNAVFRDPSAWYHCVVAVDGATTTYTNSVKIYINGAQITAFSTQTNPTATFSSDWNNNVAQNIGRNIAATNNYYDGYIAEFYNVPGQQLPTAFGAYDTNGVWQPAAYTGTYGTNGFYLPFTLNSTSTYAGSFNGTSKYLTTPTSSNLAFGTGDFTIEGWFNQTTLNNSGLVCQDYATGVDIRFNEGASNVFGFYINNSSFVSGSYTNAQTAQWHHFALVRSGSGSNNVKLYLDGVVLCQTTNTANLTSNQFRIGANLTGGTTPAGTYFSGSISNVRVVKGTAVYTAPFTPPTSALTAITNTQLLTLQDATIVDNSSNAFTLTNTGTVATASATPFVANITSDASGNNNGWTSNNINYTSSGTTYDSMLDSPTNAAGDIGNYAVLNPINGNSGTFSAANLQFVGPTNWSCVPSTILIPSTGKWFVAATLTGSASGNTSGGEYAYLGVAPPTVSKTAAYNSALGLWVGDTGWVYNFSATGSNSGSSFSVNNEVLVAVDRDANTYAIYKNGSSVATGTIGTTSGADLMFVYGSYSSSFGQMAINFGQRPLANAAPSGYSPLCTQNLTTPTITNGAQNMAATTYTGTGSPFSVSNSANNTIGTTFQPDFVWIKGRSVAYNHALFDVIRGARDVLQSNATAAAVLETAGTSMTSFDPTGFSLGTNGATVSTNVNGSTFIAWQWKAGGTASTIAVNAYGSTPSIASSVSANTTAGFSVVTYTGTGANATVGHGLGVAPSMIIVKRRSTTGNWPVYHTSLGNAQGCFLNLTNGANSQPNLWASSSPNSTIFNVGNDTESNQSGATLVAYCFAPVAGYSAFGSYTGNNSADGPFVYLGFRPRFLMIKDTTSAGAWWIGDSSRATNNVVAASLFPNTSGAESSIYDQCDFLSNGFKWRANSANSWPNNVSGNTYIYAAFAENPFKISRAR